MATSAIGPLDITFTATLGRVQEGDTWTCVKMPNSATVFATRGLVKVAATIDDVARLSSTAVMSGYRNWMIAHGSPAHAGKPSAATEGHQSTVR